MNGSYPANAKWREWKSRHLLWRETRFAPCRCPGPLRPSSLVIPQPACVEAMIGVQELNRVELVRHEFRALHEGNAVRFGLRPLEFAEWLAACGRI